MLMGHTPSPLSLLWSLSLLYTSHGMSHQQSWRHQNLSSVPKGMDPCLRGLDLSHNLLRQLDLPGLPELRRLDLSYNHLELFSERTFQIIPGLEDLNLARNDLHNHVVKNGEALRHLHGLRRLDISLNSLNGDAVELYLHNKSFLEHLNLTGNGLTILTSKLFSEAKSLRTVILENNLITDIEQGTFEPLRKLETLNLARNNLANICDFKLHKVKFLNLSSNAIQFFITREDKKSYKLEILDLSYNNLLYFPVVPRTSGLKRLHLQHNMVGAAGNDDVYSTWTLMDRLSGAEHTMENDDIYSTWRLMPLVYIDLSSNHFRSFPGRLSYLTSLEILNFSNNCLPDIKYNATEDADVGFPSLRYLDLQKNDITYLSPLFLQSLPNLETLNLQQNSVRPCSSTNQSSNINPNMAPDMSCVTFSQMRTLRHLNLKENSIDVICPNTFEQTPLVSLSLERNRGMVLSSGALDSVVGSLQSLGISETNMTNSGFYLPCMTALTQLNVSSNNLADIPNSIVCSPLRELDIRNNGLTSLDDSLVASISMHLSVVYISGNPFNCCDTAWLTILQEAKVEIPDLNQSECVTSVNGSNICLTEFLHSPSMYCLPDTKTPELSFGQVIIFILFVTTVFMTLVVCVRKMCCQKVSIV